MTLEPKTNTGAEIEIGVLEEVVGRVIIDVADLKRRFDQLAGFQRKRPLNRKVNAGPVIAALLDRITAAADFQISHVLLAGEAET